MVEVRLAGSKAAKRDYPNTMEQIERVQKMAVRNHLCWVVMLANVLTQKKNVCWNEENMDF